MTDLHSLFTDAASPHADQPTPDHVIDADIRRGHRALTVTRARRGAARTALVAAVAIGAFAVVRPAPVHAPGSASQASSTAKSTSSAAATAKVAIKLVSYTGAQPDGYTVDSVPDGWEIQGVKNFALVIAAKGDPDRDINSFAGKIMVALQSKDLTTVPAGIPVTVGKRGGVISHIDAETAQLFFTDAHGHKIDIQVPATLHWSDDQIAAFGASVRVNPNAEAGVG